MSGPREPDRATTLKARELERVNALHGRTTETGAWRQEHGEVAVQSRKPVRIRYRTQGKVSGEVVRCGDAGPAGGTDCPIREPQIDTTTGGNAGRRAPIYGIDPGSADALNAVVNVGNRTSNVEGSRRRVVARVHEERRLRAVHHRTIEAASPNIRNRVRYGRDANHAGYHRRYSKHHRCRLHSDHLSRSTAANSAEKREECQRDRRSVRGHRRPGPSVPRC